MFIGEKLSMNTIPLVNLLRSIEMDLGRARAASMFIGLPELQVGDNIGVSHAVLLVVLNVLQRVGMPAEEAYPLLKVIAEDATRPGAEEVVQILDNTWVSLVGWRKLYNFKQLEWVEPEKLPPPVVVLAIGMKGVLERIIQPAMAPST